MNITRNRRSELDKGLSAGAKEQRVWLTLLVIELLAEWEQARLFVQPLEGVETLVAYMEKVWEWEQVTRLLIQKILIKVLWEFWWPNHGDASGVIIDGTININSSFATSKKKAKKKTSTISAPGWGRIGGRPFGVTSGVVYSSRKTESSNLGAQCDSW